MTSALLASASGQGLGLSLIDAIGAQTKMVGAEYSGINARVPALRIGRFSFTGATAAESGE